MVGRTRAGRALVAEAIGTFVLVLFGVGAALMSDGDYVATGLSFGVAMMVACLRAAADSPAHTSTPPSPSARRFPAGSHGAAVVCTAWSSSPVRSSPAPCCGGS